MSNILKNTAKFAIGTCFTLGAVAVAASVVAGSNVCKIVYAGFKGAKNAVQEELATLNSDTTAADEVVISSADFEN